MATAPPPSQQTTLLSLPLEVKSNILSHLSDIDSLNALSRSCKAFHHAYCEYRKQLLFLVSMQEMGFGGEVMDFEDDDDMETFVASIKGNNSMLWRWG